MKKLVILGAGTGGTIMANKLRKALPKNNWEITIIDREQTHYYQPGFLFIPFGTYSEKDVVKPNAKYLPKDITIIHEEIDKIEASENFVLLNDGSKIKYDYLIVATGAHIAPEETPGMKDKLWYKNIFDFYTVEGALALHKKLETWQGGKLVMAITELPFKCPIAPIEFVCLADEFLTKKGLREKCEITFVTPLAGAFTKPIATQMLSKVLSDKKVDIVPDFYIEHIDNDNLKLVSYDNREVTFDLLVIVPLNKGAEFIGRSGLGDDLNYIPVNKTTLQHETHANIFVLGDAAALPTSKAGSVVHFESEVLFENIMNVINGKPAEEHFDGHANCFIETGFGKGTLIDFNYDTQPYSGVYPYPVVGPMKLLKVTRMNHWGKLAFRWIYWNMLLKARFMPITNYMSLVGKKVPKEK